MPRQLTEEKVLTVLEELTRHVGRRLSTPEKGGMNPYPTLHDALGKLAEEFWEVTEEIRKEDLHRIAEEYFDVAVVCVIAVASLIAEESEIPEKPPKQMDDIADRARRKMIERAQKVGLHIATEVPEA